MSWGSYAASFLYSAYTFREQRCLKWLAMIVLWWWLTYFLESIVKEASLALAGMQLVTGKLGMPQGYICS